MSIAHIAIVDKEGITQLNILAQLESEALALWRHLHQLFLYAGFGTKMIFTSEYHQTTLIL